MLDRLGGSRYGKCMSIRNLRRIGIDFDGVLVDHRPHKLRLALEGGDALESWQTNANVMKKYLPEDKYKTLQETIYGPLTREAPPVVGALANLALLAAEIYIVSSRRTQSIRFAQDWLVRHRVYDLIPAERIVFCGSDEEKRGYCERFAIDLFLDDKINVLDSLPARTGRVLFDEDGIADVLNLGDRVKSVKTWAEFIEHAEGKKMLA